MGRIATKKWIHENIANLTDYQTWLSLPESEKMRCPTKSEIQTANPNIQIKGSYAANQCVQEEDLSAPAALYSFVFDVWNQTPNQVVNRFFEVEFDIHYTNSTGSHIQTIGNVGSVYGDGIAFDRSFGWVVPGDSKITQIDLRATVNPGKYGAYLEVTGFYTSVINPKEDLQNQLVTFNHTWVSDRDFSQNQTSFDFDVIYKE